MAFPPGTRSFEVKVNRKARRAALKGALTDHARNGTFALLDGSVFEAPSTRKAADLLSEWSDRPTLVVTTEDEDVLVKSFRNLENVLVTVPAELEVVSVVWARSVLVSEAALPLVLARAGAGTSEETEEATE
jgi:large subunit ribosomal protein L4